ncbi:putative mitochondrial outer membrane protein [Colletotrichum orbiculare MAFF 240422]|uniref:Mitochondrial outer membrane protein n=1 Tax=Colletotrichum orbiculare (strain 104-T / ATCC 96160 / CBS 514.97 / LARS 414 / MAFF 240422) TaxID=1213857 RepID=A0A484FXY9_COLOR|nr:putative mitochondrial outer membrane protein [Colletotrichum orbiculare MAFF 240422]
MTTLAPYHIISYATLLGSTLFQTFINTKICYTELPRPAFTTLQKRLFPVYFRFQSFLLALTVVTFPPGGPITLLKDTRDWVPFVIAGMTAALNLFVYGPRTRQAMIDRSHQETRDAKLPGTDDAVSPDMQACRRRFSRNHAMSIHLNLLCIFAMVAYGIRLASRLDFTIE